MIQLYDLIYDAFMLPLEIGILKKRREKIISKAKGKVLEIGTGTGVNLSYYQFHQIKSITFYDLKIGERFKNYRFPDHIEVNFREGTVEEMDFADHTFDSIVFSLVFCTVANPLKGLKEIYRVLKPDGKIFFMEHVMPEKQYLKEMVNKINPVWTKFASGCNLNRETVDVIRRAGFKIKYTKYANDFFIDGIGVKGEIYDESDSSY